VHEYVNYIDGRDSAAADGRTFTAFNPTTGAQWGTFALAGADDVDRAVRAASRAFRAGPWGALSPTRRGRLLMKWGEKIAEHADRIATIETEQNGKLFAEMRAQARTVQDWLYYFGGLSDKIEGAVIPLDRRTIFNYTLREPLGVVGVITPWNSPTFIAVMSLAPALAAGNTIVLKPSEITSGSAIELARLAEQAGIPPGVINVVTGFRETGEALVDHPQVAMVWFTGWVGAGRAIAARAGQRLVSCMLELGGKSPNIVFADANLDQAEAGVLAGIFAAAGQTCVAGARAYIQQPIYDQLVDRLVRRAGQIAIGDPLRPETQMGPIATKMQLEKDESMVRRAVEEGGAILCGGARPQLAEFPDGYFFQPTIVHQAAKDSFLMRNEVFGPVLAVTPFTDEADVLALANDTEFGLAAGVWTKDVNRAHKMARALEAGTVWVNTYRALTFNSPFGGYKSSGIGRQNGIEAVHQYLQTKSVWVELGDEVQDPFVMKV
jgi:acyl-CoA reductase-like NAD-dependent aldehyde dehydrogenase